MPFLPPADLPPPAIVQTVQTASATPDGVASSPEHGDRATTPPSDEGQPYRATPPEPESLTRRAQFVDTSPVIRVADVPPPTFSATQAALLQAIPGAAQPRSGWATGTAAQPLPAGVRIPWVAQSSDRDDEAAPNDANESDQTVLEREAGDEDTATVEGDDAETPVTPDEAAPVYPRAATPERDWSNGAVVDGTLLTPTQPTNRPPAPLNLTADYQEFEPQTQILTAQGDVVLRLGNGVLRAERLWANLANRFVVVDGDVLFTRGEQVIEADRGEYNLIQGAGTLFDARGTLFIPSAGTDLAGDPTTGTADPDILAADPITNVEGTGNLTFGTGLTIPSSASGLPQPTAGGAVRRFRFEATQLDFDAEGWYAQEISLTNDPFSPPELEFRGNSATLTRLTDLQDELYIENARLVFDQSFTVPLLRDRILLTRGEQSANPLFVTFGYDGTDRDGLFVERPFEVYRAGSWRAFITPQVLVQRLLNGEDTPPEDESFLSNLGLEADVVGLLGPRTGVRFNASFSGLDLQNLEDRLRSSVRVRQLIGTHVLNLEYSYRDRLFNGSLGFQDVQSNLGAVLVSPSIPIGDTGIAINYQVAAQYITADTDRLDLANSTTPPFRASLGRFQGSVAIGRSFFLWRGETLPATPEEGLRFTATPRLPNVQLALFGRGTYTYYTSDDTQDDLSASVRLTGEFGHFSRDFFDSTVFNVTYTRSFVSDAATSPFFFDRNVDNNRLSGGIIQQLYGPFRLGFQASVNLDTGEIINTDYLLEYNRRTYGVFLRYSPTQSAGFFGFRINEFDWAGRAPRFGGADIGEVEGGVVR
ncbi:DUF3769 domain-containing protein [Halomicronema sp. CCY15110]|uniref:DUF3769 domain-containing protein n=1 Tax=Halomicronema sp. CCY15110 TaxID=2767773 RepID=UPI00194DFBC5|nr:DUF3769 domain-containing protein [Halomicronema sp. CCY15110]